ncbi:MAG: ABC transporter ATP-binding protein [Armatimonadota bacterium]|nr:ABC transporter ATP-binding protein [Armatimonadota bacterium]
MLLVESINVAYGDLQVLWDVSLSVREGELVALIGANGAGKTTTLRAITGLLRPRSGRILFDGKDLTGLSPHRIVEMGIAHVPEGRQLFPLMTVEEHLLLGSFLPRARARRTQNLERVLSIFPVLRERFHQVAETLSGGEQQMLAIARALMSDPKVLLLDEPSLGLAPLIVKEVFGIIEQIHKEGVTILLVEQNVQQALTIADRAFVMENGRVVLEGSGSELLAHPEVKKAYLGM